MKKNTNSKSNKDYKNILSPLSKKPKITFSHSLFKEVETNKMGLSHKKSQDELLINKKITYSNKNHRRIKSNSGNYIENMTNFEQNFGLNTTMNQLSFFKGKKKKEKVTKNENKSKHTVSRNKKIDKNKDNFNNLHPLSCSVKDFRNCIIKEQKCENDIKKYYNKEIYLNKSNLIINNDIMTNIEETRNTTSINNINNNNLIYSKHINEAEKENENKKNKKYIKICRKPNCKLYSPKSNNNPKINYTNANNDIITENPYQKYNLHRFIYNNNNLKTKINKNNKNNISAINYNSNYLYTTKKSFRKSAKFSNIKNYKNLSIICPTSDSRYNEPLSFYNSKKNMKLSQIPFKEEKHLSKKNFPSSTTNKNKNTKIKFTFTKYKKRSNKSQENIYKSKINESEAINEFDSVEEIHFMFVEMNQRKKKFFKNHEDIYEK